MKQKRHYRSGVMFYGKTNSSYQSKQNGTFGFQKGDTGAKIKAIRKKKKKKNSPPLQKNKKPERDAPNLEAD